MPRLVYLLQTSDARVQVSACVHSVEPAVGRKAGLAVVVPLQRSEAEGVRERVALQPSRVEVSIRPLNVGRVELVVLLAGAVRNQVRIPDQVCNTRNVRVFLRPVPDIVHAALRVVLGESEIQAFLDQGLHEVRLDALALRLVHVDTTERG